MLAGAPLKEMETFVFPSTSVRVAVPASPELFWDDKGITKVFVAGVVTGCCVVMGADVAGSEAGCGCVFLKNINKPNPTTATAITTAEIIFLFIGVMLI